MTLADAEVLATEELPLTLVAGGRKVASMGRRPRLLHPADAQPTAVVVRQRMAVR